MYWVGYFFDKIFAFEYFVALMGGVIAILGVFCALFMVTFSNLSKIIRCNKRTEKFFKSNSYINNENRAVFNRRVIKVLPARTKKAWLESAVFYSNYCSDTFAAQLKESARKAGNGSFVTFVFGYVGVLILLLIALIGVNGESYLYAGISAALIFGGALAMVALAAELYFLDKKCDKCADGIIGEMNSRSLKAGKSADYSNNAEIKKVSFSEAVKTIYGKEYQQNFLKADDKEVKIVKGNEEPDKVVCIESRQSDSVTNKIDSKTYVMDEKDARNIDGLIAFENNMAKGNNPIFATSINSNGIMEEAQADKLVRLEALINKIVESGVSDETIKNIHDAVKAVSEHDYAKPIDALRLKCLIKKLEQAM